MGKEIEHKYLVNDNSFISLASSCYTIKQGYICREKERTVRIRIKDEKAFITIKGITIKEGNASTNGSVLINGTNFANNYGGGIIVGNSILELNNCTIQANMANNGAGGIYAFAAAELKMNDCTIDGNSCVASSANGGGIVIDSGASLEMDGGHIINNSAGSFAGGIYVMQSTFRLFNVLIEKNSAGGTGSTVTGKAYGGVYVRESQGVLVNCTIFENTASNIGGGLGVYGTTSNPATTDIISCTITENEIRHASALGGGLYVNSAASTAVVNIYNSIISGNTRGTDGTNFVSDIDGASGYVVTRKKSISSAIVIGEKGEEISTDFNFSTMMKKVIDSNENITYYELKGDDNPAQLYGMSQDELYELSLGFVPQIPEEIISSDLQGLSRSSKKYMGSCVK